MLEGTQFLISQSLHFILFFGRNKAQDALWFGETYGLIPQSLKLQDKNGMVHEVNLSQTGKPTLQFSIIHPNNYNIIQ